MENKKGSEVIEKPVIIVLGIVILAILILIILKIDLVGFFKNLPNFEAGVDGGDVGFGKDLSAQYCEEGQEIIGSIAQGGFIYYVEFDEKGSSQTSSTGLRYDAGRSDLVLVKLGGNRADTQFRPAKIVSSIIKVEDSFLDANSQYYLQNVFVYPEDAFNYDAAYYLALFDGAKIKASFICGERNLSEDYFSEIETIDLDLDLIKQDNLILISGLENHIVSAQYSNLESFKVILTKEKYAEYQVYALAPVYPSVNSGRQFIFVISNDGFIWIKRLFNYDSGLNKFTTYLNVFDPWYLKEKGKVLDIVYDIGSEVKSDLSAPYTKTNLKVKDFGKFKADYKKLF